ncbi:hypothetical protein [Pantoea sp. Sc1]|uniref:hypothetical protein n=1 Tax=Pantoea sp. Sc1 TaxID=593105 RepID=UPI001146EB6D|nr:hypothetical protein [Pantoea sp. Sc1]
MMQSSVINNIDKITTAYEHNPLSVIAIISFVFIVGFLRWLAKNIKVEHLFQHTLSNKIRFIGDVLKEGVIDEQQRLELEKRHATLLNQKIYGVKNSFIQREVINIIDNSSEINNFNYFAAQQYALSINREGRIYVNKRKIKNRICEAVALSIIGLVALFLGLLLSHASLVLGLAVCLCGLIFYFAGLGHFPVGRRIRKQAEKEIENYYQYCETEGRRDAGKKKPA